MCKARAYNINIKEVMAEKNVSAFEAQKIVLGEKDTDKISIECRT